MEITPVKHYDLDRYPEIKERFSMRGILLSKWSLLAAIAAISAMMQGCRGPS